MEDVSGFDIAGDLPVPGTDLAPFIAEGQHTDLFALLDLAETPALIGGFGPDGNLAQGHRDVAHLIVVRFAYCDPFGFQGGVADIRALGVGLFRFLKFFFGKLGGFRTAAFCIPDGGAGVRLHGGGHVLRNVFRILVRNIEPGDPSIAHISFAVVHLAPAVVIVFDDGHDSALGQGMDLPGFQVVLFANVTRRIGNRPVFRGH